MNIRVQPVSGNEQSCLSTSEPFDTGRAIDLVMKLLAMGELSEQHGQLAANEDGSPLALHMQVIGSVVSDTSCDLLAMIFKEQNRLEAE